MKKTLTLAFLLLSALSISAQQLGSLDEVNSATPYLIHNSNGFGYCIFNSEVNSEYVTLGGATEIHSAGLYNDAYLTPIDPMDSNNQWLIIPNGNNYYVKNVGQNKFLCDVDIESTEYDGTTYEWYSFRDAFFLSSEPYALEITDIGDGTFAFRSSNTAQAWGKQPEQMYMCAATQKENAIAMWTISDLGSTWYIEIPSDEGYVAITGISLDQSALSLTVGASCTLSATVTPSDATYRNNVKWSSSNPAVATVEGGVVTAIKSGRATITCASNDGKISATCTIVVTEETSEEEQEDLGTIQYYTFQDGQMVAIPLKYIISETQDKDGIVTLSLVGDTTFTYTANLLASKDTVYYGSLPEFESFKFNNKFNDQLYTDAIGVIDSLTHRIDVQVACIGKRLTPSFKIPDGADAWVNGIKQQSKVTRRRFDSNVKYTVAYPKNWIFQVKKVSDAIWSNPDTDESENQWIKTQVTLTEDMVSTNAPSNRDYDQGLIFAIDGNDSGNYFHSTWGTGEYTPLTWSTGAYYGDGTSEWPYIEITPADPVQNFQIEYVAGPANRRWTSFIVQGSNDGENWTEIQTFTEEKDGLASTDYETWTSPIITNGTSYKSLRLQGTSSIYKNYITLTELKLYSVEENPNYGNEPAEPTLIADAVYSYDFVPYGTDYSVCVDFLTDHPTNEYSVPAIYINTYDGSMISSKEYYWDASFEIDGAGVFPDMVVDSMRIKGRGNTSWSSDPYSKNPYRLKFAQKIKPFGMTGGKNWVLLANKQTGSMTSNAIAMKIADMVGSAGCNHIIPVELYINGMYRGSYNFTEKVGFSNNSIDIVDETNATMLEIDTYYDEAFKFMDGCYNLPVNIKEPELDDAESTSNLTFDMIETAFNDFTYNLKIAGGDVYTSDIDVDAFVKAMLVTDLTRNQELKHPKSWFLYNEDITADSAWVFGPVWDFDWAFGYDGTSRYYIYDAETSIFNNLSNSNKGYPFFFALLNNSDIVKKAYYREWTKFLNEGKLDELLEYCDDYYDYANPSFVHNATKWSDGKAELTQINNAKNWLTKRANYIYSNLTEYDLSDDLIENEDEPYGEPDRVDPSTIMAQAVDVYTINGIRVRTQVPVGEAFRGLMPGIYIMNGKKIMIR